MEEEENIMLELKEKMAFLENLHSSLSKSKAPANITTLNIINDLEKILDILNSRSVLAINTVLNLVDEVFIEEFSPLLHLHKLSRDECNSLEISALLKSLREWVTKLRDSIENDSFKERKSLNSGRQKPIFNPDKQKPIYNSEKYYTDRIKELEAQKQ